MAIQFSEAHTANWCGNAWGAIIDSSGCFSFMRGIASETALVVGEHQSTHNTSMILILPRGRPVDIRGGVVFSLALFIVAWSAFFHLSLVELHSSMITSTSG